MLGAGADQDLALAGGIFGRDRLVHHLRGADHDAAAALAVDRRHDIIGDRGRRDLDGALLVAVLRGNIDPAAGGLAIGVAADFPAARRRLAARSNWLRRAGAW